MGFSVNVRDLPALRDYNSASNWERGVSPIRGKTIKPLGKRTAQHKQIIRHNEGLEDERIACRLYDTDCVTYYKDGRTHLYHGGHVTLSTAQFIDRITCIGRVFLRDGYMMLSKGNAVYQIPSDGLWIDKDGNVTDPVPFEVHSINRAAAKTVRAKYAAFIKYAVSMSKLSGKELTREEFYAMYAYGVRKSELLPSSDNIEEWADLLPACFGAAARSYWSITQNRTVFEVSPSILERTLKERILHDHNDEVFDVVQLPVGEYKKDSNLKYFR